MIERTAVVLLIREGGIFNRENQIHGIQGISKERKYKVVVNDIVGRNLLSCSLKSQSLTGWCFKLGEGRGLSHFQQRNEEDIVD